MSSPAIRLGILSTASIADYVLDGLREVPTCVCTVVASRSIERAKAFARMHDIPKVCTYEELFDEDVDAVYIPIPTALATDWGVRFASAGFHVMVDKPFDSAEGVQRIIDACEEKNVYFMDATHFVHGTRTKEVRERIRSGAIGDVKRIVSSFSIPIPLGGNIRSDPKLEPMGALGDLGWYVMRSAVAFLGTEVTSNVLSMRVGGKYHGRYDGIIECAEGIVEFGTGASDRVTLTFLIDCRSSAIQHAQVVGTTGSIDVSGFVVPPNQTKMYTHLRTQEQYSTEVDISTTMSVSEYDDEGNPIMIFPVTQREVIPEHNNLPQISMMMREFSRMIRERDDDAARQSAKEALVTQKLVDAAFVEFQKNALK